MFIIHRGVGWVSLMMASEYGEHGRSIPVGESLLYVGAWVAPGSDDLSVKSAG